MNRREFIKSGIAAIIAALSLGFKQKSIAKKSKWANFGERLEAELGKIALGDIITEWPVGGGYKVPEKLEIIWNEWGGEQVNVGMVEWDGCYVEVISLKEWRKQC